MFQASNMTYMRRREAEKKATKRALAKAELRRQKMEELMEAAQENIDKVNAEEEEGEEEERKPSEFYDVCNNYQKTETKEKPKKKRSKKVITASD